MHNIKYYIFFTILIFLVGLFIGKTIYHTKNNNVKTIIKVERDTLFYYKTVNKPIPYLVDNTIYDTIVKNVSVKIDTANILRDYFAKRIYNRKLVDDSTLTATIEDTVYKNELGVGKFSYRINRPSKIITETTVISKKYSGIYIGAGVNYDKKPFLFSSACYGNFIFSVNVDVNGVLGCGIGFNLTQK